MNNDDGGHLIANILNGPGEQINYVAMKANLNRGQWKAMEHKLSKALKDGKKVEIVIEVKYDTDMRPYKFRRLVQNTRFPKSKHRF